MKKFIALLLFSVFVAYASSQNITAYNKKEVMIPMRDGVKLYTVIFTPRDAEGSFPILIQRTPYGADIPLPKDSLYVDSIPESSFYKELLRDVICWFSRIYVESLKAKAHLK